MTESNVNSATFKGKCSFHIKEDPNSFDLKGTVNELKTKWKLKVIDNDSDDKVSRRIISNWRI